MPDFSIRRMNGDDRNEVVAVTARAFWNDPLFDYFTRDLLHEYELLPRLFRAYLKDVAGPEAAVWVAERAGRPRGVAGWISPGGYPRSATQELGRTLRTLRVIARAELRTRAIRLLREVEARHPRDPHWYLSILATDPTAQGRGVGSALLGPVLERCDGESLLAYTETQKRDNVSWYGRFGFVVADTVELADTPPVWCLLREPARA